MLAENMQKWMDYIVENIDKIKNSRMLTLSDGIRVIATYDKSLATSLFSDIPPDSLENVVDLSYYVLSAKAIGFSNKEIESILNRIENMQMNQGWSNDVWVNSIVLRALGIYGIGYAKYTDLILSNRRANGSWFDKIWVTSYGLMALYYCNSLTDELKPSIMFIKNHLKNNHWEEWNDQRITPAFTTSMALESLLLIGEGYKEEYMKNVINWCIERIEKTEDLSEQIRLLVPLTTITTGQASEKTCYHSAEPIYFRKTEVSIGTQVQGNYVRADGDYVSGDKVERKLGDGAIDMKDAVVHRSEITTDSSSQKTFKICPYCGKEFKTKKQPRFCPYCTEEL